MVIDILSNAGLYYTVGSKFHKAFQWLTSTDLANLEKGKYEIEGTEIFAIVNEYDTVEAAGEQLESHRKYIDIQYIVKGEELIGHDFLTEQVPSKAYDHDTDFMLYSDKPAFFSRLQQGMFAIFYPTDLHMPNVKNGHPAAVKKVVIKIGVTGIVL